MPTVAETSAGGLVVRQGPQTAEVALIGRRTRQGSLEWVLPKGHVEPGESAAEAAVREVAEETGIAGRVVRALGSIEYWFIKDGRRVHKTVHHFLLDAVGGELSRADLEVEDVEWVPLAQAPLRLAHPDERSLTQRAAADVAELARMAQPTKLPPAAGSSEPKA